MKYPVLAVTFDKDENSSALCVSIVDTDGTVNVVNMLTGDIAKIMYYSLLGKLDLNVSLGEKEKNDGK